MAQIKSKFLYLSTKEECYLFIKFLSENHSSMNDISMSVINSCKSVGNNLVINLNGNTHPYKLTNLVDYINTTKVEKIDTITKSVLNGDTLHFSKTNVNECYNLLDFIAFGGCESDYPLRDFFPLLEDNNFLFNVNLNMSKKEQKSLMKYISQ